MKWLFTALAVSYMTALWILSSNTLPDVGLSFSLMDKIAHFFAFGFMAFLIFKALFGWKINRAFLLSGAIAFFYGIVDELHQYFVPGRNCDIFDLIADLAGILTILFLIYWFQRRRCAKGFCN